MNYQTEEAFKRLLLEIQTAEEEVQDWQAQVDKSKAELFALMEKHDLSTIEVQIEEEGQRATIVRPTQLKFDEQGLQDAVSEAIWRTITKRVIDKKALEDAVTRGKVEPSVISKHSKEVATKPYLRITR